MSDPMSEKKLNGKMLRKAREHSLQFLYRYQLQAFSKADQNNDHTETYAPDKIENEIRLFQEFFSEKLQKDYRSFSQEIIKGTLENYANLESKIKECAPHWNMDHMSKIDITLLYISFFELIYLSNTPKNVIINEAIELAKKFSSKNSSKFINGVLDTAARKYGT